MKQSSSIALLLLNLFAIEVLAMKLFVIDWLPIVKNLQDIAIIRKTGSEMKLLLLNPVS
nr:MAG TPA: hypothetical protein [Caudoviricetes sp.]